MGVPVCSPLRLFQHTLAYRQVSSLLGGISVISSYASRWYILACGAVQGDVCWCNLLIALDLGAISRHIACVSLGHRLKNIAFPWSGSVVF